MEIERPKVLKKPLAVPQKLLMGPGPSNCHPRILQALSNPILGHLHAETIQIMDEIKEGLKYVFQTKNDLTLAVSAAGHAGMEAVLCNLLEPGDKVLIANNGYWGVRAADMAKRYGAEVLTVDTKPGTNFSLDDFEKALVKFRPHVLFVTQGESSTGVYQPLKGIGEICHRYDCLLAVDTVASLGGVPVLTDKWKIDAIYTGSQKVLGAPPGLTPISFSKRAQDRIFRRKKPVTVFYWDMTLLGNYWGCFNNPRVYHHTGSATLFYALREGLAITAEEGIENVIKRHERCAEHLHRGLRNLRLEFFVDDPLSRLPTVTAVKVPSGIFWKDVVDYAMNKHSLEISGGLGPTGGQIFRIGIMGYNADIDKINFLLKVLEMALQHARFKKNNL